jgi:hypothetical protein
MSEFSVTTQMSVTTFINVATSLPSNISVLLRAKHGIGKSQLVRQLKKILEEKTPVRFKAVIDRRLSQMSEGDMIGLPSTDGNVTRFNPPDWFMMACNEPCILFLDEQNRATQEVMQASFQIVLDRELNGHKLHPDTRVYSAINTGSQYTVNDMDPALVDRFWVVDLQPTTQEWITWAKKNNIEESIVEFIQHGDKWLHEPKNVDPGSKHPSPRSWERLSLSLQHAGIADKPEDSLFWSMCTGFVGTDAANAFYNFAKNRDGRFTGEEVLNQYPEIRNKAMKKAGNEKYNIAIDKLIDHVVKADLNGLTDTQKKSIRAFMSDLPGELRTVLWAKLTQQGANKLQLAKDVHSAVTDLVLDVFGVPMGAKGQNVVPNIPSFNADKKEIEEAKNVATVDATTNVSGEAAKKSRKKKV